MLLLPRTVLKYAASWGLLRFLVEPAASVRLMAQVEIVVGALVFFLLQVCKMEATYGRYSDRSSFLSFGPPVAAKLAWAFQEAPSFLAPLYFWWRARAAGQAIGPEAALLLLGFMAHYFNRTCIYPFQIRGGKPTPFSLMMMAFFFTTWNGFMLGYYHTVLANYPQGYFYHPQFLAGFGLFLVGAAINVHADHVLRNLRKPGETGYKIPFGGAFEFVSSANYFGEILEWFGFAVASNSLAGLAFAVFTFCNLAPRAVQHHAWYLQKFDNYPNHRKAVLPFLC
eukprot:g9094.t1